MTSDHTPVNDSLSRQWFDAASQGRLLYQRSRSTGAAQFYPRSRAVSTLADDVEWHESAGLGRIYSFSVVRRSADFADDCPYVLALVDLDEGFRVTSRIVGVDPDSVRCEQRVRVTFAPQAGGVIMPVFEIADEKE